MTGFPKHRNMKKLFVIACCCLALGVSAQNDRVNDFNTTHWLQSFNTVRLDDRWSLLLEFQWRRANGFRQGLQELYRTGVNYKVNDQVSVLAGYAFVQTHPYGDYPIAANGSFPEHRVFEQLSFRHPVQRWLFTHRFRLEQRWLQRIVNGTNGPVKDWNYLNRFRYQFRAQYRLKAKGNQEWYAAAADELFIGAGKNLGTNIFDQNRLFLLTGYKFSRKFSLEAGYFNQTLQQGRRVNNQTIMQRNNGLVLSSFLTL